MPALTMELVLLAALCAAGLAVALRSPFHAFCVFVVTLPLEDALSFRGPYKITLSYVALIVLILVCATHRRRRETAGSFSSPLVPYVLAYLGAAALSLVMNIFVPPPSLDATSVHLGWRVGDSRGVIQFGFLVFSASTFFLTLFFCSRPERLRTAVALFLVVSALVALYSIFQMVGVRTRLPLVGAYAAGLYEQPASLRPNATFQEPMLFGHFLLAGLPLIATLLLQRRLLHRPDQRFYGWPALLMLGLMAVGLMLTISRGAWLGAIAAGAIILLVSPSRYRNPTLLLFGAAGVVAVVGFVIAMGSPIVAWDTVANRFSLSASSVGGEQRLWYQSLLFGLIQEYPLLGVGYGNYPLYQLTRFDLYGIAGAYGIYWQSLVETGVIGFVSLIAMLFVALRTLRRGMTRQDPGPWRPYLAGWMASLTGLFVAHLFLGDRLSLHTWAAFGFAMAAAKLASEHQVSAPAPASATKAAFE